MSKIREQFVAPPQSPLEVSPTGDLRPFERLLAIVTAPYTERTEDASAALPGTPKQTQGYRTFCGT